MTTVNTLRRAFMLKACAMTAGVAFASASSSTELMLPRAASDKPHDVDRKFFEDGKARPFAGNTIISQIPLRTPINEALTVVRNTIANYDFSRCLSLLPPSSYHMTVFEGVIDEKRMAPFWPNDVPRDASIQACTQHFIARLRNFFIDKNFKILMKIKDFDVYKDSGATVRLAPASSQESQKLRDLRDRLAQCLGIRSPEHDDYGFHITLGYLVQWMNAQQIRDYELVQKRCMAYLQKTLNVLELDCPRFCTFNDMLAFDDKFAIGQCPELL